MGLTAVGLLLAACGLLLLGLAQHEGLVRLLTDAFPVWRGAARSPDEQQRLVRSQMRATAAVLLLLGLVAFLAR